MDAIISEKDGVADQWGEDYFKRRPPRLHFLLTKTSTVAEVVQTIKKAVTAAGAGGLLIFNDGHGAGQAANPMEGIVDLAPGGKLRLGGANNTNVFVNVFYDVNLVGPPGFSEKENDEKFNAGTAGAAERAQHWSTYQQICQSFQQAKLRKVVFLTCNVGNSSEFLRKIANDWGVVIEAYKKRMVLDPQANGHTRMHLEGDTPGFGTNVPAAEENLPLATAANSIRVGPPLATTP